MTNIGKNIKQLRTRRRLTQPRLAQALGTTPKVISDYELSKASPPTARLPIIAKFFGVTIDELIGTKNISFEFFPKNEHDTRHGNSRSAKLLGLFEQLSKEEQRMILKQIKALVRSKG